jgi:translocator protein
MNARLWTGLLISLLLAFSAAALGSGFAPGEWYAGLTRPAWTPPDWLFGPVWTVLYSAMAVAAWLVWRRAGFTHGRMALSCYGLQLALNAAWSWLFFGLQRPDLAFAGISLLWLAILATMIGFARIQALAAWLLAPYLIWVSFAAILNLELWRLNQ